MHYWLVKTEPEEYSYDDLVKEHHTKWDGVNNALARRHMRNMAVGDKVFVYHTGKQRAIVGVAEVCSEVYPDEESSGIAIDLQAVRALPRHISLKQIKLLPEMASWELVRLPRLSVMPVPADIWANLMEMAHTRQ